MCEHNYSWVNVAKTKCGKYLPTAQCTFLDLNWNLADPGCSGTLLTILRPLIKWCPGWSPMSPIVWAGPDFGRMPGNMKWHSWVHDCIVLTLNDPPGWHTFPALYPALINLAWIWSLLTPRAHAQPEPGLAGELKHRGPAASWRKCKSLFAVPMLNHWEEETKMDCR